MRGNNLLILVVALILGGLAALLARNWLLSRQQQAAGPTAAIVVASKSIPFGTTLSRNNITTIPWGAKTLPAGAFTSEQEVLKGGQRTALSSIASGEPILKSKITAPGQRASLSALIDKNKRAITIRVDDVRGVAGFILPNDHVDVVLNHSQSTGTGRHEYSDILLQDVKVIAVDQIAADRKDHPIVAKAVTLEVTPYQAQKISLAMNVGRLSLILRRSGDSKIVVDRRVSQSDLTKNEYDVAQSPEPLPVIKKEVAKAPEPPAKKKEVAKVPEPPAEKSAPKPPPVSKFSTVAIVRGVKNKQDYRVIREGP